MEITDTLLLKRNDVAELLNIEECIAAVENAFKLHAEGNATPPGVLGVHTNEGGFHIKAGVLGLSRTYFAAKVNANFPGNKQNDLPTIQGVIVVCDGSNGKLLALMDSIEITIIRTGAATAVAAKYLSLPNSKVVTIYGCGNQGRISLRALLKVRKVETAYAFDIDKSRAALFAKELSEELKIKVTAVDNPEKFVRESDITVTCTPSKKPFLHLRDIKPGTFIAAVGADSEGKQELCSELLTAGKVIVDLLEQSKKIGEFQHIFREGQDKCVTVHAELGEIIAGQKTGRESGEEIIIFDSTGIALQDVAAATIVYEKALANKIGTGINFGKQENKANMEILLKNKKAHSILSLFYPFR